MRTAILFSFLVFVSVANAAETTITDTSRVVDGDTVVVGTTRVRLKGVDAAEMNTALGRQAKQKMIEIVGKSKLTCRLTGEKTYKREVGFCFTADGTDIGRAIVEQGFALSCVRYDKRYAQYETEAAIAAQSRARYCGKPQIQIEPELEIAPVPATELRTPPFPLPLSRPPASTMDTNTYAGYDQSFGHELGVFLFLVGLPVLFFVIWGCLDNRPRFPGGLFRYRRIQRLYRRH